MTKDQYVSLIHKLPCVVHYLTETRDAWLATIGDVHAHHLESVRHAYSDWAVCPLCPYHHEGAGGVHHLHRREFALRYKLDDVKMLAATTKLVIFYLENAHGRMGSALAASTEPRSIFRRLQ